MSLSHTPALRFRRTPEISFTPGPNTWAATHPMRQTIERFQALFAVQGQWHTRPKDPTIGNCRKGRKGVSEHLNEAPEALCSIKQILKEMCLCH